MSITPDTSILVRAVAQDDPHQNKQAADVLREASLIALPLPTLCELVWVLDRGMGKPIALIAEAIRRLAAAPRVRTDMAAVEAGLEFLEAGGDFADGVIAAQGLALGGETFVTFDRKAARVAGGLGRQVRLVKT